MTAKLVLLVPSFLTAFALHTDVAYAAPCESLRSLSLPNVTVTRAMSVPAGPFQAPGTPAPPPVILPAHCRVAAVLTPSSDSHIEMELWMPVDDWNGKFEAVGNGGWAGVITYGSGTLQPIPRNMAFALSQRYATASTDTGHRDDGGQARFAAGHPEKMTDFAYRAVHEMTVVSKAIIASFYGNAPKLSYWNGCSTGGRQGLMEAQRFPEDYDGIVAGAPANFMTHLSAAHLVAAQAAHQGEAGNLTPDKLRVLHDAVMRACDARDHVRDGILDNPPSCSADLKSLACTGATTSACLTSAQLAAAETIYEGAKSTRTGDAIYPGMAFGSELGWHSERGLQPLPISLSYFKDLIAQDTTWDYPQFDLDRDVAKADAAHGASLNAVNPTCVRSSRAAGS